MSTMLKISIFFLTMFKKVKFDFYVYIHNILAEKLLSLVKCSCEIESFFITSPNISSILN